MISDTARPVKHPHTASRLYSGEAIILNPAENVLRMLNPTGSRIWELVDGSRTVAEIGAILSRDYAVEQDQATRATAGLLQDLAERQMIVWQE
jgi:hypothetical protein